MPLSRSSLFATQFVDVPWTAWKLWTPALWKA